MIYPKQFLDCLEKTDFNLLTKQKLKLAEVIEFNAELGDEATEALDGILNLLDSLTDIYFTGSTL